MDPRTHVAHALVRLHADPAPLPEIGTLAYRSRLLDETGGDFRPLVMFLLQLAEAGIPAQIEEGAARGERWEETHRRLGLTWAAEHYTQPEMARWGVAAWGAALKQCPVPAEPKAEPERPAVSSHVPSPATRGNAGRGGAPSTPQARYQGQATFSPAATTRGAATVAHGAGRRGYFNRAEKQALVSIGLMGLVAAGLIAIMSPPDNAVVPSTPVTAPSPASGGTTSGARPPSRAADATSPAATNESAATALAATPLDPIAISRMTRVEGAALLRGPYRITTRRQGVYGDDRCNSLAATIAWNQSAVDTILVDAAAATFRFATRPSLAGTVQSAGVFSSQPIASEKDGTRTTYRLQGQLTPWGFEATSDTRSESTIRWRNTMRCEFVASLSGERLR